MAKTYLWIEDREEKASYQFWTTFMHEICPEVIVESKTNNRELVKAVKGCWCDYYIQRQKRHTE